MKNSIPLYNTYYYRLTKSTLFRGLSTEILDEMMSDFRFESWNKGSQHDSSIALQRFYVIIEGRMKLIQTHPISGKQVTLLMLKEGDVYDVLTLLDGKEHDLVPVAQDDLKLLSAPIEKVREWVQKYPEFNKNYLPYLGGRIRIREALVTDLFLYDTPTRIVRLILRAINSEPFSSAPLRSSIDVTLLYDLSNEELAQMVGAARQVVNRHLQVMKKDGLLHFENHHLIVDDLEKLKHYAEGVQQIIDHEIKLGMQ